MPSFVACAIAAYAIWGLSNFLDRVVVSSRGVSGGAYTLLGAACTPVLILLSPWVSVPMPSPSEAVLALAAGAAFVVVLWPYYAALETEEASRVVPLWHLEPIFLVIGAKMLWGEVLPSSAKLAFPVLLFGSFILSVDDLGALRRIRPRTLLMLPAVIAAAAYALLTRALVRTYDPIAAAFLIRWCFAFCTLALLSVPAVRRKPLQAALDTDLASITLVAATLLLGTFGFFLFNRALKLGPAAIVTAMSGATSLVLLMLVVVVGRVAPDFVAERIDRGALIQKGIGVALMGGGVALLALA